MCLIHSIDRRIASQFGCKAYFFSSNNAISTNSSCLVRVKCCLFCQNCLLFRNLISCFAFIIFMKSN